MTGRGHEAGRGRIASTRNAIGLVSDVGGAAVALSMLAAGLVGSAGVAVGIANDQPGVVVFGGGAVFGVALGAALIQVASARASSTIEAQRGYRWVQATYTYAISAVDHHHHTQTVHISIRAIRDGVRVFTNQYRWSGSGKDAGPKVTSDGHTLSGPSKQALGWRSYVVSLHPVMRKGQETTIAVHQEFVDEDERFDNFLAKTVHEKMEKLTLRVELPTDLVPSRAWRVARDGIGPEAPEADRGEASITVNGTGATIQWVTHRPVVGLTYELYWDYPGETGLYTPHA